MLSPVLLGKHIYISLNNTNVKGNPEAVTKESEHLLTEKWRRFGKTMCLTRGSLIFGVILTFCPRMGSFREDMASRSHVIYRYQLELKREHMIMVSTNSH